MAAVEIALPRASPTPPAESDLPPEAPDSLPYVAGQRYGPWQVVGLIGRGGMGEVVRAERADGAYRQTVAIKLILPELTDAITRQRFLAEREALARLRHPAIVRLLDAGEADGRPWLAMDFVAGRPLLAALATRNPGIAGRLALFRHIAEAVAHAHRALVVHGDIHPGNILIDDEGGVHLLDFGIARLLDRPGASRSLATAPADYIAPERQGRPNPGEVSGAVSGGVSVASDVFSLGMLLHDLVGPSARRGEIGAIAARALAHDPGARYPDVTSLLDDLERLTSHRPLRAHGRFNWVYLARLYLRRHHRAAIAALALIMILTATTAISLIALNRAQRARAEAETRAIETRAVAGVLMERMLPALEPVPGTLALRAKAATMAVSYLDRQAQLPGASAQLRREAAESLQRLAEVEARPGWPNLGEPVKAHQHLLHAVSLLEGLDDRDSRIDLACMLLTHAELAADLEADLDEAHRLAARATEVLARLPAPGQRLERLRAEVATDLAGWDNNFADAARTGDVMLARLAHATSYADRLDRFRWRNARADADYYLGHIKTALTGYQAANADLADLRRQHPDDNFLRAQSAMGGWNIASTLLALNRLHPALTAVNAAVADADAVVAREPVDALAQRRWRVLHSTRAQILGHLGQTRAALDEVSRYIAINHTLLARQPNDPQLLRDRLNLQQVVGEIWDANRDQPDHQARACAADRSAEAAYAQLARARLATVFDTANRRDFVARIGRNCPAG